MSKQKKRLIGMGMEPRTNAVKTAVSAEEDKSMPEVEVSNNSGQPEVVSETVQVWSDEKPNGGSLDLEPVQNLESAEGVIAEVTGGDTVVAQVPVSELSPSGIHCSEVREFSTDALERMLEEPKTKIDHLSFSTPLVTNSVIDDLEKMIEESKEAAGAKSDTKEEKEKKLDAIVELIREEQRPRPYPEEDGPAALGELPNGEYRATVRLAEWCKEGCKQQAAADGLSLEDWLTEHLGSYLDAWWNSNGAK